MFYPSPTPKREWKYRVLTIDGKCSCGSKQGYNKEEWVSKFEDNVTWTPKSYMQQPCPYCGNKYGNVLDLIVIGLASVDL